MLGWVFWLASQFTRAWHWHSCAGLYPVWLGSALNVKTEDALYYWINVAKTAVRDLSL